MTTALLLIGIFVVFILGFWTGVAEKKDIEVEENDLKNWAINEMKTILQFKATLTTQERALLNKIKGML